MNKARTYYVAELVGAVEGHALLGVATLLADMLKFPLESIGQMPIKGGNTGILVLWATASSKPEAIAKARSIRPELEARGGPMLEGIGPTRLKLCVMDKWRPIASSLAGGLQ